MESAQVVDFDAAQDGRSRMLDGKAAWYLFDIERTPNGTEADPPVVAFSSREAAEEWRDELGGTVVQAGTTCGRAWTGCTRPPMAEWATVASILNTSDSEAEGDGALSRPWLIKFGAGAGAHPFWL